MIYDWRKQTLPPAVVIDAGGIGHTHVLMVDTETGRMLKRTMLTDSDVLPHSRSRDTGELALTVPAPVRVEFDPGRLERLNRPRRRAWGARPGEDLVGDVLKMYDHYGHTAAWAKLEGERLDALLDFRERFVREEFDELVSADTPEKYVDALIDLVIVALGTLLAFNVDARRAFSEVHNKNMSKRNGENASRPSPLGLPDLVKPDGWTAPDHRDNVGRLKETARFR